MESDEYEIMPHKELMNLKTELKKLRTKGGKTASKVDVETMDGLNTSIQELINVVKQASKEMKSEENEEAQILHKLTEAIDMMNTIVDQNEKIAEGIVTVAEMIKDHFPAGTKSEPPPSRQPFGTIEGVPVLGAQEMPRQDRRRDVLPHRMPSSLAEPSPPQMAQQYQPQPTFSQPQQPPSQPFSQPSQPFPQQPPQMFPQPSSQPQMGDMGQASMGIPGSPSPFPDFPRSSSSMDNLPPPPAPPPPRTGAPQERGGLLSRFK